MSTTKNIQIKLINIRVNFCYCILILLTENRNLYLFRSFKNGRLSPIVFGNAIFLISYVETALSLIMSRVGYNDGDPLGKVMSMSDNALAGAITATFSRAVCQPFDVLKIRLQLQTEDRSTAKYRSLRHAMTRILKEEGIRAYWKGHVPGQGLSILYGGISVGLYQSAWHYSELHGFNLSHSKTKSGLTDLVIGSCAAVPATIISYPLDVIRTRLVCQSPSVTNFSVNELSKTPYTGTINAFTQIVHKEGWKSLFKGLPAALYTVPVYNGLSLCMYNSLKPFLLPHMTKVDDMHIPLLSDIATGFLGGLSGLITKTLTFPMDTVKKRLQVQGFAEGRAAMGLTPQYHGFWNCFLTILRTEGVTRGLFKGWVPGIIKAFPNGIVHFVFLERALYFVGKSRKKTIDKSE